MEPKYTVTHYAPDDPVHQVVVSFELASPCWCSLENSEVWKNLVNFLEDI